MMGVIVSVNVGLPQDVAWQGQDCPHGGLEEARDRAKFSPRRRAMD